MAFEGFEQGRVEAVERQLSLFEKGYQCIQAALVHVRSAVTAGGGVGKCHGLHVGYKIMGHILYYLSEPARIFQ